ncbi:glutathione S-transferase family protein [Phyllobacterium lublinensis]|jgi:glutathione S-transferase|uniref:glutathione S-transferase family protein n=1 Tax=Phyllobacterium lublinensis TaxID=2875708 RepID=UPI001CCD4DB4|nr:glutathione S-transferase [Phyllobacterium sp. 2063]MBZ9653311.1 glutathione S-transferase [Phyllobacterium sp. 2063]
MLKIWGRTNSNNVKKALWAAEEVGVPYENIAAGGTFGVVSDPAYKAMNPNGLVPTLQDRDLVLWESNTIVRYLAAQYGRDTIWIEDTAARAKAEKWMDWTTSTLITPFRDVFLNMVRTAPDKRDHAAIEKGRQICSDLFGIVDATLESQPYLSGETFGIGDIPLGGFVYAWFEMAIERPDQPHLLAWYQRLQQRPAYQKAVMIPLT